MKRFGNAQPALRSLGLVAFGAFVIAVVAMTIATLFGGPDPRVAAVDSTLHFDAAREATAAAYARIKYAYWGVASIVRWGALAALVLTGGGVWLARIAHRMTRGRAGLSAAVTTTLMLGLLALLSLPVGWLSGYSTEIAYGLSTQSTADWLVDTLRRQGVWIFIYSSVAGGFLACIGRWPRRGWLVAGIGAVALAFLGMFLAPHAIDPLFHRFTPLDHSRLESEIIELGDRAGIEIGPVLVMDASRSTRRVNAYVTGVGITQQVVLYDNLVRDVPTEEVLLVVAHEIGHKIDAHLWKGLLLSIPAILLGAWALGALARRQALWDPRITSAGDPAGIPLLWLALSLALVASQPIENTLSRRMEAEADWISLQLTADPETFVAVAERLTTTNLSAIRPSRWTVAWFYSHPPILERIGMGAFWSNREHATVGGRAP